MGNEHVTDEFPLRQFGGNGANRQPPGFRYTPIFEKYCSYYMSLGMSYSDYWDGDCVMTKYYREQDRYTRKRENFNFWLQGAYFYDALLNVAPALRPFIKNAKPMPYRSEPLPLSQFQTEEEKQQENLKKMKNGKEAMMAMMVAVNKRFGKKDNQ